MRIDVIFRDAPALRIVTSGESMLSGSTLTGDGGGRGLPVCALALRVRTDLVGKRGRGLVVEVSGWSTEDRAGQARGVVETLGGPVEAPCLAYHAFRVWEVLPVSALEGALAIDIDGVLTLLHVGDAWLDLTAYHLFEGAWLSGAEAHAMPLAKRVLTVHDRVREVEPGATDAAIGKRYGLGLALVDYARTLLGRPSGAGADDGLDSLVAKLASSRTMGEAASVLADALLEGGLTRAALEHAMLRRGQPSWGVGALWQAAEAMGDDVGGFDY